jgi:hypothetical protein
MITIAESQNSTRDCCWYDEEADLGRMLSESCFGAELSLFIVLVEDGF